MSKKPGLHGAWGLALRLMGSGRHAKKNIEPRYSWFIPSADICFADSSIHFDGIFYQKNSNHFHRPFFFLFRVCEELITGIWR